MTKIVMNWIADRLSQDSQSWVYFFLLSLVVHLFVLLASAGVINYDYLIPMCFLLCVASLVSSYSVCRPIFTHLQQKWGEPKDHPA